MTAPGRSVSYLPGRWTALVMDGFCLLSDVQLSDPLLAHCWVVAADAAVEAASDAVLDALARAARHRPPSFVLLARAGEAVRLVVAGGAHAEVFAGDQDPAVYGAVDGRTWFDQRLDSGFDVRLVADDPTPFERISPLPLTAGIVLASYVFSTAVTAASTPSPAPSPAAVEPGSSSAEPGSSPVEPGSPPAEAVGWIPPPLAQPSQEYPVHQGWTDEPAPQLSGVFRALPWRSSLPDEPEDVVGTSAGSGPEPEPSVPGPDAAIAPPDPQAESDPDVPDPAPPLPTPVAQLDPSEKPSFGAPGYVPPPFGAEAFGAEAFGGARYAYPPPPPFDAVAVPPPAPPQPGPPDPGAAAAPLVQAVRCANGHFNPLHIEVCRVCGAGFAPQQPATVERPPLGVLRLPTGATVVLDRDALLGRAPFAVDQRSVRLVEVASPANDISRSHVRITLDGWQVFATDLGSTNGTAVTLPGQPAALLRAHDPFALSPGAVLSLADEADVRFEVS